VSRPHCVAISRFGFCVVGCPLAQEPLSSATFAFAGRARCSPAGALALQIVSKRRPERNRGRPCRSKGDWLTSNHRFKSVSERRELRTAASRPRLSKKYLLSAGSQRRLPSTPTAYGYLKGFWSTAGELCGSLETVGEHWITREDRILLVRPCEIRWPNI
jgi:hypothetical protein